MGGSYKCMLEGKIFRYYLQIDMHLPSEVDMQL
jgi:hypothetical protein